ncbi:hypothetical protein HELRODRAFT_192303 [Helobdella robusta]|uniref:IGFBP N-terminal domain-containing protein n=1 Tax=Helobdella robusta TaxID=6412 RepID=T1FTT2_HELRO|nr:hypothetical protein HELRODRAFT_192303 [Helobdella robusta]ESO01353.1 hypothetical protein HELRODRAFT_192303 [Helobdella robusta]
MKQPEAISTRTLVLLITFFVCVHKQRQTSAEVVATEKGKFLQQQQQQQLTAKQKHTTKQQVLLQSQQLQIQPQKSSTRQLQPQLQQLLPQSQQPLLQQQQSQQQQLQQKIKPQKVYRVHKYLKEHPLYQHQRHLQKHQQKQQQKEQHQQLYNDLQQLQQQYSQYEEKTKQLISDLQQHQQTFQQLQPQQQQQQNFPHQQQKSQNSSLHDTIKYLHFAKHNITNQLLNQPSQHQHQPQYQQQQQQDQQQQQQQDQQPQHQLQQHYNSKKHKIPFRNNKTKHPRSQKRRKHKSTTTTTSTTTSTTTPTTTLSFLLPTKPTTPLPTTTTSESPPQQQQQQPQHPTLNCPPCNQIHCPIKNPANLKCRGGHTTGVCGCCRVCSKLAGERCGGIWNYLGSCDIGLVCFNESLTNDVTSWNDDDPMTSEVQRHNYLYTHVYNDVSVNKDYNRIYADGYTGSKKNSNRNTANVKNDFDKYRNKIDGMFPLSPSENDVTKRLKYEKTFNKKQNIENRTKYRAHRYKYNRLDDDDDDEEDDDDDDDIDNKNKYKNKYVFQNLIPNDNGELPILRTEPNLTIYRSSSSGKLTAFHSTSDASRPEGHCIPVHQLADSAHVPRHRCAPRCSRKFCQDHPEDVCSAAGDNDFACYKRFGKCISELMYEASPRRCKNYSDNDDEDEVSNGRQSRDTSKYYSDKFERNKYLFRCWLPQKSI